MTNKELQALKELSSKATPGPWKAGRKDTISFHYSLMTVPIKNIYMPNHKNGSGKDLIEVRTGDVIADSQFIAASREAIPSLIAEVERLREVLGFYCSEEALSCPLKSKYEDKPKCLEGDSDYFQDPADLPYLQDMGKRAREALAEKELNET